ncbi:MAG: sugar kinase [Candidatus Marinimicrobia bacterium]|nr:sugar kinase [Candidatus Neomarinimicrobiota bacterium]
MIESSLLITGSIAIDTIETPEDRRENVLGGSVTYALIAAHRYVPCHVVGIIGTDFPKEGKDLYQSLASNLSDLQEVPGATFSWGGRYLDNWDDRETLFTDLGVFGDFKPLLCEENKEVKTVLLANIHPELQNSIIDQSEADIFILDTMNLWINTTRPQLEDVLKKTNILLLNESEAELLTNHSDPQKAGTELLNYGPEKVIVKLGSEGALFISETDPIRIGAYPVEKIVDPTGAGDVFAGAFSGILAAGGNEVEAIIQASALASICVEGFGAEKILNCSVEDVTDRINYLQSILEL